MIIDWRVLTVIAVCSLIVIGITMLTAKFTTRNFFKYVPAIFLLLGGIASFIRAGFVREGFGDIIYALAGILALILFVVGTITAIIIDVRKIMKRRNGGNNEISRDT